MEGSGHQHRSYLGSGPPYQDILGITEDVLCIAEDVLSIAEDVLSITKEFLSIITGVLGIIVDVPCPLVHSLLHRNLVGRSLKITRLDWQLLLGNP